MRILILVLWVLLPVGALAYHLGPGQTNMKLDQASKLLAEADLLASNESWDEAQDAFDKALDLLPDEKIQTRRRVELERAKVMMNNKGLSKAHGILKGLVDDIAGADEVDDQLLKEARIALANSQYYMTWLMRLEGQPRAKWEPEIKSAQQTFRLLAQQGETDGETEFVALRKEDLESAVRLHRMEIGELQGLPLPSQ